MTKPQLTPAIPVNPRTLHLVDIENLLGGTDFTAAEVAALRNDYVRVSPWAAKDQLILASSHFTAPAAWFGWGYARRLLRSGRDGADIALLGVLEDEDIARRFSRVVVASGDGIFAEPCALLQGLGCDVTVVSRQKSTLSRRLAFAVKDVRFIQREPAVAAAALRAVA